MQVDRKKLTKWLLTQGFEESSSASGHLHFTHPPTGNKITVLGHGPVDMTKKHVALTIRQLMNCGFQRAWVREELANL